MTYSPSPLALGPLLDALRGVTWPTRERVRAGMPGAHRALQRGTTGEFTEFRAYRQGDDPRRIDWRLLARSDRAFVRVTDERAWYTTWLVLDASASMAFPESGWSTARERGSRDALDKWTMIRAVAIGLSAAALATGDPVGLHVALRPDGKRLPARTRRGTVQSIARTLESIVPGGEAALAPVIARVPAGTRVVVCSDMLGDTDETLSTIARMGAAGSAVTLVHVVHPLELSPPRGAWQAIDPRAASDRRALSEASYGQYTQSFAEWRSDVARRCLSAGARYLELSCDEEPARAVRRIATVSA